MEDRSRKGKVKTDSGRKEEEEERVVTNFPKSCTFFTGVGFHMLRMFFVRSCKLILPIFCRHLLSQIKSTCAECPRAAINIPRQSQERWDTTASGLQTCSICLSLRGNCSPAEMPCQKYRFLNFFFQRWR